MFLNSCRAGVFRFSGQQIRRFCTNGGARQDITKLSLITPIRTEPQVHVDNFEDNKTSITTLPSRLRIASQDRFGAHCAIGVIVDAGPRYESNRTNGLSHFLEKLGFHSTESFKDRDAVQAVMEECNAIFDCQISRDFIIYAVSGLTAHMDRLVRVLSETVLRSRITADEVGMAARSIGFELQAMQRAPPVEPVITELLHSAAFGGEQPQTLGLPRYCPLENLEKITRDDIISFLASYYRPERMVVAGAGVEHESFVNAVEKAFSPCEHILCNEPAARNAPPPDTSVAQYTGGYAKVERDLSQYHAPMPEFAHASVGFESCGSRDPFFVTSCLLQSLLGGGGSFSAGGPGKGMYTRLYVNVLNQHHWVNSAQAENHAYTDTGLFSITGSSDPAHLDRLVYTLIGELRHTAESRLSADELSRAKAQLKSMLLMNMETRAVTFEDIARQVLTSGTRHQPEYWVEKIDAVSATDVQELLHRMLQSPPTVVGFGRVGRLPSQADISRFISRPITSRLSDRIPGLFKRFI
ncbi:Mitochondrial-processing peptidase subunit alpha [Clonorchis sinensis]|uniref:Alpha-MPP n=1 Tax=Clonorchis sinensis TaxID=79923 RepID=A0A8T1MUP5_CLOSI|nr:Mitochondrial-processing peptidase subunit alpha [Clonorchis sinensis]